MIDFHSHILPEVDDGAQSLSESVQMLRDSAIQGVTDICATPHFYPDCDDPEDFLTRRNAAAQRLIAKLGEDAAYLPRIHLGAEIYYFPGMSTCSELKKLKIGKTSCLLVELPTSRLTDYIVDEIEEMGRNLVCIPVIAHIDRYIRINQDVSYAERFVGRKILVQANASFFFNSGYEELAFSMVRNDRIHFIGSDCHGAEFRKPNMISALNAFYQNDLSAEFDLINSRALSLLKMDI